MNFKLDAVHHLLRENRESIVYYWTVSIKHPYTLAAGQHNFYEELVDGNFQPYCQNILSNAN